MGYSRTACYNGRGGGHGWKPEELVCLHEVDEGVVGCGHVHVCINFFFYFSPLLFHYEQVSRIRIMPRIPVSWSCWWPDCLPSYASDHSACVELASSGFRVDHFYFGIWHYLGTILVSEKSSEVFVVFCLVQMITCILFAVCVVWKCTNRVKNHPNISQTCSHLIHVDM